MDLLLRSRKRTNDHDDVVQSKKPKMANVLQDSRTVNNKDNILNNTGMISPPVTPDKQRTVLVDENDLTPKKLLLSPPSTPTKIKRSSVYSLGKNLFQRGSNSSSDILPSRELEALKLNNYLEDKIMNLESGSLYISGPPGTGKTAQTTASLKSFIHNHGSLYQEDQTIYNLRLDSEKRKVAYVQLNCMIIKKPEHIYDEICKKLLNKTRFAKYTSLDLKQILDEKHVADVVVVVLDELDNLITGNQQILFELFSYASSASRQTSCKLVLIGIANALDLTDRFLPRLKVNRINPTLLQFLPYSSDQIKNVIESKLRSISNNVISLIHPAAIQLCAKKTASNTGDLRKAFDICHRSLEIMEDLTRTKLTPLDFDNLDVDNAPKVSIAVVAKVCNMVFNASNFGSDGGSKLKGLNLQQKTVVCSLIKFELETESNKTINEFYEFYRSKIKLDNLIGFLKKGEFLEVITTLESFGVINSGVKNVQLGTSRISANVKREDLMKAVENVVFLRQLIV